MSKEKLIGIISCDEVYEELDEFYLKEVDRRKINKNIINRKSNLEHNSENFMNLDNTNYSQASAYTKFFDKYRGFDSLVKKGLNLNTPSYKFIQGIKDKIIIPNPVGLVKRNGNHEVVNVK